MRRLNFFIMNIFRLSNNTVLYESRFGIRFVIIDAKLAFLVASSSEECRKK